MKVRLLLRSAFFLYLISPGLLAGNPKPNIVYVLCDDLGYGDVHCLNPQRGKIATPHIDRLASQGMVFTDAHSGSAVCTPTRYGILTGRYSWRSKLQQGVLNGFSEPLIPADRLTVPAFLKQHGYHSACIGKWHLGLTFAQDGGKQDLTKTIGNGPVTRGFNTFFGISASLDMPPYAFIENDHFTQTPTVTKKWVRSGPAAPDFEAVDVLPTLATKAAEYITTRAAAAEPFFLYLPLASPHTPVVPSKQWQGKSALGEYGDFVMETDWALGEVLAAIDKAGITDNTLVIFTSDNGFAPYVGADKLEKQGHYPSAGFRGYKADAWEGGHRVPFIVRWPDRVKPATTSDRTTCLTDLMATCADVLKVKLPDHAGEDSVSMLPALQGFATSPREATVHHSVSGRFAIREGKWKLLFCPGSGGWAPPKDAEAAKQGLPAIQLYDISTDPAETTNLQGDHPDVVERLTKLLEKHIADGRSTPGPIQKNDAPIDIRKQNSGKPRSRGKR